MAAEQVEGRLETLKSRQHEFVTPAGRNHAVRARCASKWTVYSATNFESLGSSRGSNMSSFRFCETKNTMISATTTPRATRSIVPAPPERAASALRRRDADLVATRCVSRTEGGFVCGKPRCSARDARSRPNLREALFFCLAITPLDTEKSRSRPDSHSNQTRPQSAVERFCTTNDFHQFRGDRSLARSVVLKRQRRNHVLGVLCG